MTRIEHQNSNEPLASIAKTTGQKVRELRHQRSLTAKTIADLMGLSLSGYNKLEGDVRGWSESRIRQVADILNVPVGALLSGAEIPYVAPPSLGSLSLFVDQAKEEAANLLMTKLGIPRDNIHIEIRL